MGDIPVWSDDIPAWLDKVFEEIHEKCKSQKPAAEDTSQAAEEDSDKDSDEVFISWREIEPEKIKKFNEGEYQRVIENKDKDDKIMKQKWKMTEMHCRPKSPWFGEKYEEVMEEMKENRYRQGKKDVLDEYFVSSDALASDDAEDESECWDAFFLRFVWHNFFSRFYGAGEFRQPHTLQIYTLKLTREAGEDQCTALDNDDSDSLHVYGMLHLYSQTGHLYQVLFNRKRDDCQTLTKEDPYLLLTGPALPPRAPEDGLRIQGTLKLKSTTTQSEDDDTFLSLPFSPWPTEPTNKRKFNTDDEGFQSTGKHYSLEMTRCIVIFSMVATISVKVNKGVLPEDCCFTAFTASLDDMKVVLLDSRYGKEINVVDRIVQLSRHTLTVESGGSLKVVIEHRGTEISRLDFSIPTMNYYDSEDPVIHDLRAVEVSNSCTLQVVVTWSHWWNKFWE